jgi:hypothetical protein
MFPPYVVNDVVKAFVDRVDTRVAGKPNEM